MTDIEAAAYLRELQDYSVDGKLVTPASPGGRDTFFTCAFEHAIRALEERAGGEGLWGYRKNPNGSYTPILEGDGDTPDV